MTRTSDLLDRGVTRRCALLGVGGLGAAAALAACGGGSTTAASAGSTTPSTSVSTPTGSAAAPSSTAAAAIAALSSVPVGGTGKAEVAGEGVLLSQPTAGKVDGFSNICPHQGGTVIPNGDAFKCTLHGSEFAADGTVTKGPAAKNLTAFPVAVSGDSIVKG